MEKNEEYNRLRWICNRRSLAEMDYLLGNFLESRYLTLNEEHAAAFRALAEMQDQDLWALVTGKKTCADTAQAEIIEMLRSVRVK
ncbi:MAG: succinate dehydrogenase assembly factor 2 [Propionivibrio sp.]